MHKQNAFSLVEMLVVVTILLIIMTMSVVGVRGMQKSSRDNERKVDIETIATNLETLYAKEMRNASDVIIKPQGSYMPVSGNYNTVELAIVPEFLNELERGAATAPNKTTGLKTVPKSICNSTSPNISNSTTCFVNTTALNNELTYVKITTDNYIYVPYADANRICTVALVQSGTTCRSFKLYYVLEGSPTTVRVWESKRK